MAFRSKPQLAARHQSTERRVNNMEQETSVATEPTSFEKYELLPGKSARTALFDAYYALCHVIKTQALSENVTDKLEQIRESAATAKAIKDIIFG
jgi:hypothetical protein